MSQCINCGGYPPEYNLSECDCEGPLAPAWKEGEWDRPTREIPRARGLREGDVVPYPDGKYKILCFYLAGGPALAVKI